MAALPLPLLLSVLLLLLCSSSCSAPPPSPTPPPPAPLLPLPHIREYLGSITGNFLEHLDLPRAHNRIRSAYAEGASALLTYTGILTDQLYHWWRGDP